MKQTVLVMMTLAAAVVAAQPNSTLTPEQTLERRGIGKNVKTPTLLLQGEDDTTDPIGQSQQFYRGLKRYGVDSDLVLYPREPHGLREETHLVDRLTRILAWYDRYLKPPATSPTPQR